MTILIAVGANLPGPDGASPRASCAAAIERLAGFADLRLDAVSAWYRSAPWPPGDQPDYCNGAARFSVPGVFGSGESGSGESGSGESGSGESGSGESGDIDPAALLARLHAIEAEFGRVRSTVNAPRPLDLDLIAIDGLVRRDTPPILPHPRAHLRRFVLRPLLDIAPDFVHPLLGRTVADLLAALPPTPEDALLPWQA